VDAFANDAVLFREAIAQAPSTLASHASLLTSLNPPHHAASIANNLALPLEVVTLAEILRSRGYATASFNGGIQLDATWGLDQGFDTYLSVKPRTAGAESLVDAKDRFEYVVGLAQAWIEQNETRPFFLFLHTYEVHHPYTPYAADLEPFRGTYAGRLQDRITVDVLRRINDGKLTVDDRDRQHIVNAYDGEIRSMDRAFGSLVNFLRGRGLYDRALIVFTSDHGEEFGEHGRMGWHTHSLFDELLRVPLLVKLPSSRLAGTTSEGQARGIDVGPTLLAALGLEIPPQFAGRDLLSADPMKPGELTEAFSSRDVVEPNSSVAVRTSEWKLYDGRLFNLTRDKRETEDVARPNADVARRLRNRLEAILAARRRPAKRAASPDAELLDRLRSLGYVE
jgi:arylsulfatase A-like enzyme